MTGFVVPGSHLIFSTLPMQKLNDSLYINLKTVNVTKRQQI